MLQIVNKNNSRFLAGFWPNHSVIAVMAPADVKMVFVDQNVHNSMVALLINHLRVQMDSALKMKQNVLEKVDVLLMLHSDV